MSAAEKTRGKKEETQKTFNNHIANIFWAWKNFLYILSINCPAFCFEYLKEKQSKENCNGLGLVCDSIQPLITNSTYLQTFNKLVQA